MKWLDKQQTENLKLPKRYPNAKIYNIVAQLDIGESLLVAKTEWFGTARIDTAIRKLTRIAGKGSNYPNTKRGKEMFGKKFSIRLLPDKTGHIIIRTK